MRFLQRTKHIKIDDISPNPYQTRRNFDNASLFALAESIKENGVLSPIIVRGCAKGYELICGQRRVRAASIAGLSEIPAIILNVGDAECAELSLIENIQRQSLSPVEEAEGFYNLMAYHKIKKENVKKKLSVDFRRINEKIRLLSFSEKVRYKIEQNNIPELFLGEIIKLRDEEKRLDVIDGIAKGEITYQSLCDYVKKEIRVMLRNERPSDKKRSRENSAAKMPLYKNTINKTVEMLKRSGAIVSIEEDDREEYAEFILKIHKS